MRAYKRSVSFDAEAVDPGLGPHIALGPSLDFARLRVLAMEHPRFE